MTLELWLDRATRGLSAEAAAQVRREIAEHYEAALSGATADEALRALGDPREANRQYREALLTAREARLLRQGNFEARMICAHRLGVLSIPGIALIAAASLSVTGHTEAVRILLAAAVLTAMLLFAPFLPIYTPARSRFMRPVKWMLVIAMLALAFGHDSPTNRWLIFSSLFPLAWIEWQRASIRRKLPVAQWPKHLYL